MKTRKPLLTILAAFLLAITASAQTDYTSHITNPSFEQGTEGWEHQGMSAQGNSVFSIKDGSTYMERWTGRGGAVGSGKLAQVIKGLPPGKYELTAAAYHGGMNAVDKWISDGTVDPQNFKLEDVPSSVTSNYIYKVMKAYNKYKDKLEGDLNYEG